MVFPLSEIAVAIFVFLFACFFFSTAIFTFLIWKGFFWIPKPWALFNSWKMYFVHYVKFYFDTGSGLMNYPTKVLFLMTGSGAVLKLPIFAPRYIVIGGIIYSCFMWVLGFFWVQLKFFECEQEVRNLNDAFVKEMRAKFIKGK